MTRFLLVLLVLMTLAACEATASPPDPTRTTFDNPHEDCALGAADVTDCRVSSLHSFDVRQPGIVGDDSLYVEGRPFMTVCGADPTHALCYQPTYALASSGVIPFTYCKDGGCKMEIHWWNGTAGYCQVLPVVYSGQPYLVKLTYDYALNRVASDHIEVTARVLSGGEYVDLPGQPLSPTGDTVWAVKPVASQPDLRICAEIHVPWPVFGGESSVTWQGFAIYALPSTYAGAVIEY
jgi:hypothetical protein